MWSPATARNVRALMTAVTEIEPLERSVMSSLGELSYDYLLLACGATHANFDHDEWEAHAPD